MHPDERFPPGIRVETIKPEHETEGLWSEADQKLRQWGVLGHVQEWAQSPGARDVVIKIEHEDKTTAWYETRELAVCSETDYTPAERREMLTKMHGVSSTFYGLAAASGCHALIEFTGLMNEFITVCEKAHARGEQFPFSNTHSGKPLPFEPYNLAYLAEKLDCIYGPALEDDDNRNAFVSAMFPGYELVETIPHGGAPASPAE